MVPQNQDEGDIYVGSVAKNLIVGTCLPRLYF